VASRTIYIETGTTVRIWNVDDYATLTIGSWRLTAAGHNNYDANGRWTGYTYGEATGVYNGPTGVYTATFVVVNSLGGPGASGRWAAGTEIPGDDWVLVKSEDSIVRYNEEHDHCEEVSQPTVFPARGGTRTARYIPYTLRTPVYRKRNTYKHAVTEEIEVRIEGDEQPRPSEAKLQKENGVNVSLTVPANTTGAPLTHTMYQCAHTPPCGLVITATQEAEDDKGAWKLAYTYTVPRGVRHEHLCCRSITATPNPLSNEGGNVVVEITEDTKAIPILVVCEHWINTKTGAVMDIQGSMKDIEDTANATIATRTIAVVVNVPANTTGVDRTVVVYTCPTCGTTASITQTADGDPGITDPPSNNPLESHLCAGGVFYGSVPCESFAMGMEIIGGAKVREPSSDHTDIL